MVLKRWRILHKYIIDLYDKYNSADKVAARYTFILNDRQWAIKEYEIQNGKLTRPLRLDEPDNYNDFFHLYNTFDEALQFVREIRRLS